MRRVMRQMEETKDHIESASDALAVTAEPNTCALIHTPLITAHGDAAPNFPPPPCRCCCCCCCIALHRKSDSESRSPPDPHPRAVRLHVIWPIGQNSVFLGSEASTHQARFAVAPLTASLKTSHLV